MIYQHRRSDYHLLRW